MVEMASFKKQEKFVWKLIKKLDLDPGMFHVKQSEDSRSYTHSVFNPSHIAISHEIALATTRNPFDRVIIDCWCKIAKMSGVNISNIPLRVLAILHEFGHICNNSYYEHILGELELREFDEVDKSRWTLREINEDYSHISTEKLANEWMIRKLSDPEFYKWALDTWEAL